MVVSIQMKISVLRFSILDLVATTREYQLRILILEKAYQSNKEAENLISESPASKLNRFSFEDVL